MPYQLQLLNCQEKGVPPFDAASHSLMSRFASALPTRHSKLIWLPRRAFIGTNPENAANFCIARRSGGISAIVRGRIPRSRTSGPSVLSHYFFGRDSGGTSPATR